MKIALWGDDSVWRSATIVAIFIVVMGVLPANGLAAWHTHEYGDPFEDNKRVLAATENLDGESLVLKCDGYLEDVYLAFFLDEYIDNGEVKAARVRFDKKTVIEINGYAHKKTFVVFDEIPMKRLFVRLADKPRYSY